MPNALNLIARISCLILLSLALNACGGKEEVKIPQGVLPRDTMTAILTDIHLIEGSKVGNKMLGNDSLEIEDYYQHVWKRYGVRSGKFSHSFDFYTENPGAMREVYVRVLDSLSKIEAQLQAQDSAKSSG